MGIIFKTTDQLLINNVSSFIDQWKDESDSIIVQTSGSTGVPKSIKLQKSHMKSSALKTGEYFNLKKGDTALFCLSPKTIAGKMMLVRSLVLDLTLIVVDITSTPLQQIQDKIDFAAMVPIQVEKSLEQTPEKLELIQTLIIGGGRISQTLETQLEPLSTNCYQTFGMTETISHIAIRSLAHENEFKTLSGVELSQSKENTLIINAPHIGVFNLQTNDIVELIDSNTFKWIGRKDFIINSGGIKISPEEIEFQIRKCISSPLFVTGLPDETLGDKLVLCIEGQPSQALTKSFFKTKLNKFQVPKEIYYFDQFEYTQSNKINRLATKNKISSAEKKVL